MSANQLDNKAITQALSHPDTEYFMTTNLYWDCDCESNYIHPASQSTCEICKSDHQDCADSRIHEMAMEGISLDFDNPEVVASLDEYNTLARVR